MAVLPQFCSVRRSLYAGWKYTHTHAHTLTYTHTHTHIHTHRKPNDHRNFLHYDSADPKSLKDSIPFSQALHIKRICSEASEVIRHFKDLKDAFIKRSYKPELLDYQFEGAMRVDRKVLLQTKDKPATQENLQLVVTLPNIKNVIDKHWHILSINKKFKKFLTKNRL